MKTLKSLIAVIVMLSCWGLAAAESYRYIVVETSFDSDVTIRISSDLSTSFDSDGMTFKSDYLYLTMPLSMIKGWSYRAKDNVSGLESETIGNLSLTGTGDSITVNGLPDNSKIMMSDIGGRLIFCTEASGECTFGLDNLANGIYIIAVNGRTFKIAVNR